jgi:hypothetical protein
VTKPNTRAQTVPRRNAVQWGLPAITLQFARGDWVQLPGGHGVGRICMARLTLREVLGPVVEYCMLPPPTPATWYVEADLILATDPGP